MLKKIWDSLLESVIAPPEFEEIDVSFGNLSIERVREIALKVREEQEWWLLEPRHINLYRETETGKLIWIIDYPLEAIKEFYATGTRGVIQVDDKSGEVIAKSYVPR